MKSKMLNVAIVAIALFYSSNAFSQTWGGSTTTSNLVTRGGDAAVYPNYIQRTTIGAAWGCCGMFGTGYLGFNLWRDNDNTGDWPYQADGASNGGSVIYGNAGGGIMFATKTNTGNTPGSLTDAQIVASVKMQITPDGKIVMGNPAQHTNISAASPDFTLFVEKGILTERLKVAWRSNTAEWPDYVFNEDHALMSIGDLNNYIKENKHLPNIPSSKEVSENGIDVAIMQAKLLEKIEELTLYIIELKKENIEIKSQLNEQ